MMMMKSRFLGLFLFLFLSSQMSVLGSVMWRSYKYFSDHFTWQDAQSHCRSLNYNTDLITIYTQSDIQDLRMKRYYAWIGLRRRPISSQPPVYKWTWSNGQINKFWLENEHSYVGSCASVRFSNRRFFGTRCEDSLFFICQKNNVSNSNYIFIPQPKTWFEAEQYCKEKFQDLAIIEDQSALHSAVQQQDFPVWIGLYRDGETWKWSNGMSEYRNWASGEQESNGTCVTISSISNRMATQNCSTQFPFICSRDNLVLVKENKTWEEALEHCRALKSSSSSQFELISVQPGAEQNYVMAKVKEANTEKLFTGNGGCGQQGFNTTMTYHVKDKCSDCGGVSILSPNPSVWTGLRFLAGHWLWMNQENVLHSDLPVCPLMGQHCGAFSKSNMDSVETTDCSQKLNFMCYSISD